MNKYNLFDNSTEQKNELFDDIDDIFSAANKDLEQTCTFTDDKEQKLLNSSNRKKTNKKIKKDISSSDIFDENENEYEQLKISTTTSVKKSVLTRDKVSYALLSKDVINKGEKLLSVGKNTSETVLTKLVVSLDLEEVGKISNNIEFTYFDKSVFDAVCSLLMIGNKALSLAMIARTMLGKKFPYHPNPELLNEIDESINKLERIKISIDMSEEFARFSQLKNEDVSKAVLSSRFFECRRFDTIVKGSQVNVIVFTQEPILLKYAKRRAQLSSVDNFLLDTPTKKTKNLITVQSYLLQRINMLKLNKNLPQCIMFDAIYELFDVTNLSIDTKKSLYSRIRKSIISILDYWKKENFLKEYEIEKQKGSYYKINIIF